MKFTACLLTTLLTVASFSATVKAQDICSFCNSTLTVFFTFDNLESTTPIDAGESVGYSCGMATSAVGIYEKTQFSVSYDNLELTAIFSNGTATTCTPNYETPYLDGTANCCVSL